jgi:putative oxidoreductase
VNDHLNLALMVLRVGVGVMIFAHGYNHVFRGGRIAGTGRWFASLGMRPGVVHAWLASLTELGAGALLIAGLLTPLAAGAVAGTLTVAWVTNHVRNGFFIFRPGEGWEYVSLIVAVSLALGTMGPGEWSLDDAVGFELNGSASLGAALLGVALAAALLVAFWRPPEEKRPAPAALGAIFGGFVAVGLGGLWLIDRGFDGVILEPDQISYGVLIARVAIGAMIIAHGYNHIFRGGRIAGTGRWFESLGMRPGTFHAWLASLTELGAGTLLIAGLLTPLAAAGILGVMIVAWTTNHVPNGFFVFRPGEGWEYVGFVAIATTAVGTIGGGRWSLDRAWDISFPGFDGFFLTLLGAAAAAALLATFWRPDEVRKPLGVATVFAAFGALAVAGAALVNA